MKLRLFPVIITTVVTSLMTLYVVSKFQNRDPYFAINTTQTPVHFTGFSGDNNAKAEPVNFESAAESSIKAVVHINTATKGRTVVSAPDMGDLFSQLFGQRQYYIPPTLGSGSGVVISPDGYIVTNNHVIAEAAEITITFNDRHTAMAKVIGTDPSTDIALLKVEDTKPLPFIEFGNSDEVRLGQWVLAVGYPLSLDATVTAGIISAKGRSIGVNKQASAIESYIQTDAAVNPGNSGGALVNTRGQLVGINSAIASPTGSYAGYSYAIPANIVNKAVNDLMKYGAVQRAYLGIEYLDKAHASKDELVALGIDDKTQGVYVIKVRPNSGAAKAGLAQGDYVTQINGVTVNTQPEVQEQIAKFHPGDNIGIVYLRKGKTFNTTVQLTNLNGTTEIIKTESITKLLGATLRPLTEDEKSKYEIDGGVLVTEIGKGAIARQTQMHKGFVITGVNNKPVKTVNDVQQQMTGNKNLQISGFYPGYLGMYYYGLNNVDELDE